MQELHKPALSTQQLEAIDAFAEVFHAWDLGRYAISIGGSIGRGNFDELSDIDFRLWYDEHMPWPNTAPELWKRYYDLAEVWRAKGIEIDHVWPCSIKETEASLRACVAGEVQPVTMPWCVWGYQLPVDVLNQYIVFDPEGIVKGWQELLTPYPPAYKQAILDKHLAPLRHWHQDYHYKSKVKRGDTVFLTSLAAKSIHDVMQVLFALNESYYVGDGANLAYAERFTIKPARLKERVDTILYPDAQDSQSRVQLQADTLISLIGEVITLSSDTASETS